MPTDVRHSGQPLGFVFAFANCIGFMLYIIRPPHRQHRAGSETPRTYLSGIDQLGLAMLIAALARHPSG